MSRRSRIFLGIFVVYLAAVAALLYRLAADLDPRYRESAEESLVDTANLLATLLERGTYNGIIPTDELERTLTHLRQRPIYARIFDIEKTAVDLHVYVTDRNGIVLFDSKGRDVGGDYFAWRDVYLTLQGSYGARTTLADPSDKHSAVMYVGAAIRERGDAGRAESGEDIVGMVAVGKPIAAFSPFIANARARLLLFGAVAAGSFALLLVLSVVWLVRPFGMIGDLWRAFRADVASGGSIRFGRRLLGAVRTAFAEARDTLAGRSYVEQYVQTLAHELKSPLAAIRGASELLREPMPEDARARFAHNIEDQVARAQDLIDRLLELSSLERRGDRASGRCGARRGAAVCCRKIAGDRRRGRSGPRGRRRRLPAATSAFQPRSQRNRFRAAQHASRNPCPCGTRTGRDLGARPRFRPARLRACANLREVLFPAAPRHRQAQYWPWPRLRARGGATARRNRAPDQPSRWRRACDAEPAAATAVRRLPDADFADSRG